MLFHSKVLDYVKMGFNSLKMRCCFIVKYWAMLRWDLIPFIGMNSYLKILKHIFCNNNVLINIKCLCYQHYLEF